MTTAELTRSQEMRIAVDRLIAEHQAWQVDANRPSIDIPLDNAILSRDGYGSLLEIFERGDVPSDSRDLNSAVWEFLAAYQQWQQDTTARRRADGSSQLWAAFERLRSVRTGAGKLPSKLYRESIEELKRQEVNIIQIAKIWRIDPWQVEAYCRKDQGGKREWDFPSGWVHPDDRKAEQRQTDYKSQVLAAEQRLAELKNQALAKASRVDPTPIEQLCRENVPLHQIARMKRMSVEELESEIVVNGWPMPSVSGDPIIKEIQKFSSDAGGAYTNEQIAAHLEIGEDVVSHALANPVERPVPRRGRPPKNPNIPLPPQ